jgi:hypothetical protein
MLYPRFTLCFALCFVLCFALCLVLNLEELRFRSYRLGRLMVLMLLHLAAILLDKLRHREKQHIERLEFYVLILQRYGQYLGHGFQQLSLGLQG